MQILNYVSWCICSAVSWKRIPRNGGVWLSEPTHLPAEWLSLQHCLQEDWSVHFAALGVQLSPTPGIIFVLIFANLIGGKNTALLLRCAYLWFLGRPRIFSYTWGLFGFRLLRIAIVQSWQSPSGCLLSSPFPTQIHRPSGSPGVFPTGRVSQEGRVFALRLQQPASARISRKSVPWLPGAPVHVPAPQRPYKPDLLKEKISPNRPRKYIPGVITSRVWEAWSEETTRTFL